MTEEESPMDKHAHLIGRVTIAWNDVHHLVYQVFEDMIGSRDLADSMFFCLRSDASQRDLTFAAARTMLSDRPDAIDGLKAILNTVAGLASVRNEAIHTAWGIDVLSDDASEKLSIGGVGKMRRTKPEDDQFVERFEKIQSSLMTTYFRLHEWRRANVVRA